MTFTENFKTKSLGRSKHYAEIEESMENEIMPVLKVHYSIMQVAFDRLIISKAWNERSKFNFKN